MKSQSINLIKGLSLGVLFVFNYACQKETKLAQDPTLFEPEMAIQNEPGFHHVSDTGTTSFIGTELSAQSISYGPLNYQGGEFFSAPGADQAKRPLVIIAPGGGFSSYTEMPKLRQYAQFLVSKGYNAALVKYATGTPGYNVYTKAFQDLRSAVRYFKINQDQFSVDTNNIFMSGWSSGASIGYAVANLQESEINNISVAGHRVALANAINNLGFDNADNPGVSSAVRGYIGLLTWAFDVNLIDANDPPMMLINHYDAHFSNGTRNIGHYVYGGLSGFGTDIMAQRANQVGKVFGQDLVYIRINGPSEYKGDNEAALHHRYYLSIARFIENNLAN